jgi:hypothetical protein
VRHHEDDDRLWEELAHKVIRVLELIIARLESESTTSLTISIQGEPMADFQLNAGDSVVVTVTDTDNVTGAAVTPDAGSVTAVLSSATDTVVVDPSGAFATITAGATTGTGNTVTVNATVGGVASASAVGTYDVVANVAPDATTLAVTFGTESAPAAPVASAQAAAPLITAATVGVINGVDYGPGAGQTNPVTGLVNP